MLGSFSGVTIDMKTLKINLFVLGVGLYGSFLNSLVLQKIIRANDPLFFCHTREIIAYVCLAIIWVSVIVACWSWKDDGSNVPILATVFHVFFWSLAIIITNCLFS